MVSECGHAVLANIPLFLASNIIRQYLVREQLELSSKPLECLKYLYAHVHVRYGGGSHHHKTGPILELTTDVTT
jgi:hypothetical protein